MIWEDLAPRLTQPFNPKDVQWRAGSVSRDKKRAQALAYAEPRVYEDRLNQVLGADWEVMFEPWGDQRLTCTLTLWLNNETGERQAIRRSSTGEFDSNDRISQSGVAEAQAFKRACSKFGLGRYLYDLPASWVGYDENSRRLTEIPALPAAARPQVKDGPKQTSKATSTPAPTAQEQEGPITEANANILAQKLVEFGYPTQDHLKLAKRVLERQVGSLTDLSRSEAQVIFRYVQGNPVRAKAA